MRAGVSTPQIAAAEGRRSRQAEIQDRTGGENRKNRIAAHGVGRTSQRPGPLLPGIVWFAVIALLFAHTVCESENAHSSVSKCKQPARSRNALPSRWRSSVSVKRSVRGCESQARAMSGSAKAISEAEIEETLSMLPPIHVVCGGEAKVCGVRFVREGMEVVCCRATAQRQSGVYSKLHSDSNSNDQIANSDSTAARQMQNQ